MTDCLNRNEVFEECFSSITVNPSHFSSAFRLIIPKFGSNGRDIYYKAKLQLSMYIIIRHGNVTGAACMLSGKVMTPSAAHYNTHICIDC